MYAGDEFYDDVTSGLSAPSAVAHAALAQQTGPDITMADGSIADFKTEEDRGASDATEPTL